MNYHDILDFFIDIMENMQLNTEIIKEPYKTISEADFGLRRMLFPEKNYPKYMRQFCASCQPNTIYKVFDQFLFNYIILILPDTEDLSCLVIGPYTLNSWSENTILEKAQEFHIPSTLYPDFKACYAAVPLVTDSSILFTLINALAVKLWGSEESFTLQEVNEQNELSFNGFAERTEIFLSPEELQVKATQIEKKYASENKLLQAVSRGQLHTAEMYSNQINIHIAEQRLADRVRNAKNYAIIMNTLLRKAVENCAVHPIYIEKESSAFARKIELQTSEAAINALLKEMVQRYTLLAKKHSLRGYSPLVRRVMVNIESDLSADLSLRSQAKLLGINPSYLSTVFKKETGQTLTEYVTEKRIRQAVSLLSSTNMQIQTVAEYCGITDLCYFTKIFKKVMGMTPTQYRNELLQ